MLSLRKERNLFGGSSRQKTRIELFAREKKSDQPQALAPLLNDIDIPQIDLLFIEKIGSRFETPTRKKQGKQSVEFAFASGL